MHGKDEEFCPRSPGGYQRATHEQWQLCSAFGQDWGYFGGKSETLSVRSWWIWLMLWRCGISLCNRAHQDPYSDAHAICVAVCSFARMCVTVYRGHKGMLVCRRACAGICGWFSCLCSTRRTCNDKMRLRLAIKCIMRSTLAIK